MRAKVSGTLSSDKAISTNKLIELVALKNKLVTSLTSSALVLSEEQSKTLEKFFSSKEYEKISSSYEVLKQRYRNGNYYQDGNEFFQTATNALGYVGELIDQSHKSVEKRISKSENQALNSFVIWAVACLFLTFILGLVIYRIVTMTNKDLNFVMKELEGGSDEVLTRAGVLSKGSATLSETVAQQAALLQETVSSVGEINAMSSRNAESAVNSSTVSRENARIINQSRDTIDRMITAIGKIKDGNDDITSEVRRNSEKIADIVNVISEIGEKTQVINDIVFQTKLLSFNASVEAARAGEHGKGFAVVAEEVGNLAAMSGKAAKEISDLLNDSVKRVQAIGEETQNRVGALVDEGHKKIEFGTQVANDCKEALDEITSNATKIEAIISEISTASKEQAAGIEEVTSAMSELEIVTQRNSGVAINVSNSSVELNERADGLKDSLIILKSLVDASVDIYQSKKFRGLKKEEMAGRAQPDFDPAAQPSDASVVQLKTKSAPEPIQEADSEEIVATAKASGDDVTPDYSDPRFEEV